MTIQKINLVMINKFHGQAVWTFEDMMQALLHLLTEAGYETKITVNYLDPQAINILFGVGAVLSHPYADIAKLALPHNTIIFNCEQIDSSSVLITDAYVDFLSRYVVFDWCQPNIEAIGRRTALRHPLFEMPLFPTPNLSASTDTAWKLDYDLAFYGAQPPRRQKLLDELEQAGLRIKHISGHFGQALANHLLDCRFVLNIHAYETDLLESNRCLRPMAMGIPLISEASSLPASGDWDDCGIIFVPTAGFGDAVRRIVADPERHLTAARKAVQFTHRAANALKVKTVMEHAIAALALLGPSS